MNLETLYWLGTQLRAMSVLDMALSLGTLCIAAAMLLCAWRLYLGPQAVDRVLALDTLYLNAVALVVLLGMRWRSMLLLEAAILIALLGFVSTVALARYLCRGDVVE
jgi:multicomponent K+:H+ antiporter subunit F